MGTRAEAVILAATRATNITIEASPTVPDITETALRAARKQMARAHEVNPHLRVKSTFLYRERLGAIRRSQFATNENVLTSRELLSQLAQNDIVIRHNLKRYMSGAQPALPKAREI